MFGQGLFSTVAMVGAIITLFVGIAAVTNARRLNQQKHQHNHHKEPHFG
jgi:hypothetical protein